MATALSQTAVTMLVRAFIIFISTFSVAHSFPIRWLDLYKRKRLGLSKPFFINEGLIFKDNKFCNHDKRKSDNTCEKGNDAKLDAADNAEKAKKGNERKNCLSRYKNTE